MSNLIEHAERELARAGVEEDVRPSILGAIESFRSYGHSGGSASIVIPMLNDLLNFRALTPLTDDPAEWIDHTGISAGEPTFQNVRSSECFSRDGGKTYWVLSEERRWVRRALGVIPFRIRKHTPSSLWIWMLFPIHRSEPAR
jgi:hypothetical protein